MQSNGRASRGFNPIEAGYVPVNKRIEEFYQKYPEGSLQSEIVELGENIVVVKAYAYRSPTDERPGVGHSQMPIPGKTPYTVDSEVENAETSAWGRALAALGFEVHTSVASAEEVNNKSGGAPSPFSRVDSSSSSVGNAGIGQPSSVDDSATPAQKRKLMAEGRTLFGDEDGVRRFVYNTVKKNKSADLTKGDMQVLFEKMEEVKTTLDSAVTVANGVEA